MALDVYLVRTHYIPEKYESCEACGVCVVHHRLGGSLPAEAKDEVGGEEKGAKTFLLCTNYYVLYLLSVLLSRTESSSIRRKEELIERMFRGGCKHVQIGLAYPFS